MSTKPFVFEELCDGDITHEKAFATLRGATNYGGRRLGWGGSYFHADEALGRFCRVVAYWPHKTSIGVRAGRVVR